METTVLARAITGSTTVRVEAVREAGDDAYRPHVARGSLRELEVHYRAGTRTPQPGEVVDVWVDGSTSYALAPRRG
jgi:hypothetical protein